MSAKCDAQKQVRLEDDLHETLGRIKERCPWPTSLTVLANYAMRWGLAKTRKDFNPNNRRARK